MLTFAGLALAAQTVPEVTSTVKDRTGLAVTIFHNDVALVRDQRRMRLPKGSVNLAMTDLAASIRQSSAWLWIGKDLPPITERSFEFNLLTPRKLFRLGLGTEAGIQFAPGKEPVMGSILSQPSYAMDPLLVQTLEGISSIQPDQVRFRGIPAGLRTNPTLLHALKSPGGDQEIELTYLADNFRWKPHYVLSLASDGRHMDLQAWAEVKNTSGLDLPACTLQLIAGTPNQLPFDEARDAEPPWDKLPLPPPPPLPPRMTPTTQTAVVEVVASAAEFQEASFFEYVLYTLDQPVSLRTNQSKQLALFQAKDVPVEMSARLIFEQTSEAVFNNERLDLLRTMQKWFGNQDPQKHRLESDPIQDVPHFSTLLRITNDAAHKLGRAMPAGPFLCYYESPEGAQIKIAEDGLDSLPRGSSQELFLPAVAGLTASKRLAGKVKRPWYRIFAPWSQSLSFELEAEVTLRNPRDHSIVVEVRECLPTDWEISENSHPFIRRGDYPEILDFQVELPAQSTRVLRYRVATPWQSTPYGPSS